MTKKSFFKGAVILGIAGLIVKVFGAFFRIPLANIIGDTGMGYYQTAYPIYVLLLTLSTSGIPTAIARLVSERTAVGNHREAYRVFRLSFQLLLGLGIVTCLILFAGAPYIVQKAGEAVYSEAGKVQLKEQVAYYMNNAKVIYEGLKSAGYNVSGGVNAPYIWLKTPDNMSSWDFFDYLLENAHVVGTPGSGFGAHGEGFFRLTAFGSYENTQEAIRRIKAL